MDHSWCPLPRHVLCSPAGAGRCSGADGSGMLPDAGSSAGSESGAGWGGQDGPCPPGERDKRAGQARVPPAQPIAVKPGGEHTSRGCYSHVALVGVDSVEERLGGHPLHRQAALGHHKASRWLCHRAGSSPARQAPLPSPTTHVCCLLVVIDVVDVAGQPEVSDLHDVVLGHQHVPGRQVPVDALTERGAVRWSPSPPMSRAGSTACFPRPESPSPSWRPGTPCRGPPGTRRTPGP